MRAGNIGDEEVEALEDDLDLDSASAQSGLAARTLTSLLMVVPGASSSAAPPSAEGAEPAVSNGHGGPDGHAVRISTVADTAPGSTAIGEASGAQGGSANLVGRPRQAPRGSTAGAGGASPGPSGAASQSP